MNRTAPAAILLAAGILAGCSTSEPLAKKLDYKSEAPKTADSLEVPPDLTAPQIRNKYTIPGSATASAQAAAAPKATAAAATTPAVPEQIRMERAGTQRWLLVGNKTPAELWPRLKAFWQDNGFVIKSEDPDVGVMETDWAENRAKLPADVIRGLLEKAGLDSIYSTPERDKFRIRLEKTDKGTEVYFSHRGMYEIFISEGKSETMWQPRPTDPDLEAELLGRFMLTLGADEARTKEAIKATQAPKVAALPVTDGALILDDGFDRSWRRVGLALDRIGLLVSDRDRSKGIYFVRPAKGEASDKTDTGGFWSSLAFWKKSDAGTRLKDEDLQVNVKETDGKTRVSFTGKDGKALDSNAVKTALGKLATELQ